MNDRNQEAQAQEKPKKEGEKAPNASGAVVTTKNGGRAQEVPSKHNPRTKFTR